MRRRKWTLRLGLAGVVLLLVALGYFEVGEKSPWKLVSGLHTGRMSPKALVLPDGRVFVGGGWGPLGYGVAWNSNCEIFNPDSKTWSDIGRGAVKGRSDDNPAFAYVGKGKVLEVIDSQVLTYDLGTQQWSRPVKLAGAHCSCWVAALNEGRVLIAGGESSPELFDLATGTSTVILGPTSTNSMSGVCLPDGREFMPMDGTGTASLFNPAEQRWDDYTEDVTTIDTPVLLPDGRILWGIANDYAHPGEMAFNEKTGSDLIADPVHRVESSFTLLPDGELLVVGGVDDPGPGLLDSLQYRAAATWSMVIRSTAFPLSFSTADPRSTLADCWIWNLKSDHWRRVGRLNHPRCLHTTVVLKDGRVLVIGGTDVDTDGAYIGNPLTSVEIIDSKDLETRPTVP